MRVASAWLYSSSDAALVVLPCMATCVKFRIAIAVLDQPGSQEERSGRVRKVLHFLIVFDCACEVFERLCPKSTGDFADGSLPVSMPGACRVYTPQA